MIIKPLAERVKYENNPLAEVVCQVRFDPVALDDSATKTLETSLAQLGYVLKWQEEIATLNLQIGPQGVKQAPSEASQKLTHFVSKDRFWKVSLTADFIALTCLKYETWEIFVARLNTVLDAFRALSLSTDSHRVGLRYRDIIDRERLGLQGQPWSELLSAFALGPLAATELTVDGSVVPEKAVEGMAFQSVINLDGCKMLIQGGLINAKEDGRKAFMIDTDFFAEGSDAHKCLTDAGRFTNLIETLHKNAGAMFRHIIREPLHHALRPTRLQ